MDLKEILEATKAREQGGKWLGFCPLHDDEVRSLSIWQSDSGYIYLNCFAGCDWRQLRKHFGLDDRKESKERVRYRIVARYSYLDENGQFLYEKVRYEPKSFCIRRLDGEEWVYGLKGGQYYKGISGWFPAKGIETGPLREYPEARRVPYNLQEIVREDGRPIFIVEGEKDADHITSSGLGIGTCFVDHVIDDCLFYFTNRDIVICPDADEAGERYLRDWLYRLLDISVLSVTVLRLYGAKGADPADCKPDEIWSALNSAVTIPLRKAKLFVGEEVPF